MNREIGEGSKVLAGSYIRVAKTGTSQECIQGIKIGSIRTELFLQVLYARLWPSNLTGVHCHLLKDVP